MTIANRPGCPIHGGAECVHPKSIVGPEYAWDCPNCGEHITSQRIVDWESLDAAWAAAEAALRQRADWWRIRSLVETAFAPMRWEVVATDGNRIVKADGHTPADALRALAEKLRCAA